MNVVAQLSPTDIFETGRDASTTIAESFDGVWTDIFRSDLYRALVNLGLLIALFALGVFLVQLGRRTMEGGMFNIAEFIWPLLVIMLLSNGGSLLAEQTLALRVIANGVIDTVLGQTLNGLELRQAFQEAAMQGASSQLAALINEQCRSLQTPEIVQQCVAQRREQFNEYVAQIRAQQGEQDSSFWDQLTQTASDVFETGIGLFGAVTIAIPASILLQAWQIAAQWILEIALLLVSLFGPIAVGASLLPTASKPLFAWLSGFFALAMAKVGFNLIAGIGAIVTVTSTDVVNPLVLQLFLAIFAPSLALIIGSGSGIGMFVAFSFVATRGVGTAPQVAGYVGSKGANMLRRVLSR